VTAAGWDTFSTVLRNPTSVLEEFHLGNNILNDQVIISFVDALAQNIKLRVLDLSYVDGLTELGWNALNNLLFNQSSINGAYNSNHTLEELWARPNRREFLPEYIVILLEINRDNSVSRAQWSKIRLYTGLNHIHGNNIDIQLFTGMHLSLLPYAMAWMGKDELTVGTNLLFRLVRSVPTLFEQGNN
jgi:hypothetical protein